MEAKFAYAERRKEKQSNITKELIEKAFILIFEDVGE